MRLATPVCAHRAAGSLPSFRTSLCQPGARPFTAAQGLSALAAGLARPAVSSSASAKPAVAGQAPTLDVPEEVAAVLPKHCSGCGIKLQRADADTPG